MWLSGLLLSGTPHGGAADLTILPEGSAPAPVLNSHFPDRFHEFVWRNWNIVAPDRLAALADTSVENVNAVAGSMGLPRGQVPPEMKSRGYITLIRRNWHLLPYDQLLSLLEMTPERLSFALREDDFLWIKLGSLKPKCEPVRYQPPDAQTRARAAEIRNIVAEEFGDRIDARAEPRFEFVRKLGAPLASNASSTPVDDGQIALRLVYSYLAVYGDPLSDPDLDPYPEGFLQRLAAVGVNGVWLHAVLRDLAPGGQTFPEFGAGHERRLATLRDLVRKARKHGVDVYLYLNEPRAMPHAFFRERPGVAGVREDDLTALCTSHPAVRAWMSAALAYVFEQVPGLGGIYAITASENLTNCASHGGWQQCERCRTRTDAEIIAEVGAVLEEAVHRVRPSAKVILSDWGWKGHGDAEEIVNNLPGSAWLMSVSEWNLPIVRGGVASAVGEYSISAVGPGPRATKHWAAAKRAGITPAAEIQFNNTCELASIPYLPVLDLVAEHLHRLAAFDIRGMLVGWTMGGHPSPNFALAQAMNRNPVPAAAAALDSLALARFGGAGAPHARRAWSLASEAFRQYPFHVSVVYTSPVQWGPANLLYPSKTGYRATMWGIPYDDLDSWRGPYPPDTLAAQFDKVAEGFRHAAAELRLAVEKTSPSQRPAAEDDLRFAAAAGIHFQAVANQARFILARDRLAKPELAPEERRRRLAELRRALESEIALARELFLLAQTDSRIGFEPSCHYFYLPFDLVEKVVNCRWLLNHFKTGPDAPGPDSRRP